MTNSISSGLKTTSGLIRGGNAELTGVIVQTTANSPMRPCTVTIYDSATAASGTVLFQATVPAASLYDEFALPCVKAKVGLWLSISVTGSPEDADGTAIVYYK